MKGNNGADVDGNALPIALELEPVQYKLVINIGEPYPRAKRGLKGELNVNGSSATFCSVEASPGNPFILENL